MEGNELKELLKKTKKKPKELASQINVQSRTINRWCRGVLSISPERALQIRWLLGSKK